MKQRLKVAAITILTLAGLMLLTSWVVSTCPANAARPTVKKIKPPLKLTFEMSPSEVSKRCKDQSGYNPRKNVYSSVVCSKKLSKKHANTTMLFKYSWETNGLRLVAAFERLKTKGKYKSKKKYGKKYTKKKCDYLDKKTGKTFKCSHYVWEVGETKFQIVRAEQPDGKTYGIFLVWTYKGG